jgi:hypothetical protein
MGCLSRPHWAVLVLLGATATAAADPPPAASPLDRPLQLIAEARQAYKGVQDYTCLFVKRERLRGQLEPEQLIEMKVRAQPFSVYLRWLGPKDKVGQEACYVAGTHDGMMRVHSTGLRGAVGFVSLDVHDPRVMEHNRHPITDAGIGHLIERYEQRWQQEREWNKTQVQIADYEYNKRKCTRIETVHPEHTDQFDAYRRVLYLDKETHLPIRVESYDWPRAGGAPGGELVESYSYVNPRFNVRLPPETFNH